MWVFVGGCAEPPPPPSPPPPPVEATLDEGVYLVHDGVVERLSPLVDLLEGRHLGRAFRYPAVSPFAVPEVGGTLGSRLVVVGDAALLPLVPFGALPLEEGPTLPWMAMGVALDGGPVPVAGEPTRIGAARVWSSLPPGRWAIPTDDGRAYLVE